MTTITDQLLVLSLQVGRAVFSLALFLCMTPSSHAQNTPSTTAMTDPLWGTEGGGNTVPGAQIPFGLVTFSPDTVNGSSAGYDSSSQLLGFSYTHVSGTGGASKYGNFRVTPIAGKPFVNNLAFQRKREHASPGQYSVMVGSEARLLVKADLTATAHAGYARFTFPENQPRSIVLDATSVIPYGGDKNEQYPVTVDAEILDGSRIRGSVTIAGGWNPAPYTLYFFGAFDHAFTQSGVWSASHRGSHLDAVNQHLRLSGLDKSSAERAGLFVTFSDKMPATIQLKLAVSFLSTEQAQRYLEQETPQWSFDDLALQAERSWRAVLDRIQIDGGSAKQRSIFYSALYRAHQMPHDLTGDNVWWSSREPHYEDFYTIWDTFRTVHPLLTLIEPERQRDMIRSLLDTYRHTGWLPDGRVAGANGLVQGGSSGDILLADAITKKLGGFDQELAWEALQKDAEVESPAPLLEGRELKDYHALGYMSLNLERSGSRTLEYAYDDYAVAEVASTLGKQEETARYLARSGRWKNLWDPSLRCIRPRYSDGQWLENFDCDRLYPDHTAAWWDVPFYEGSSRQYSTFVPQDIPGLIAAVGGPEAFKAWLDQLFAGKHYDPGNEPDLLAAYLYLYVGRHDLVCDRVREYLKTAYRTGPLGLPGNDDAGTLSAWYVWSAMGLYPDAGMPYYLIGSPLFRKSVISLEGGRRFVLEALNTSDENRYVQSAELNGTPLSRAWLTHTEISSGGHLVLHMGPHPSHWAETQSGPPNRLVSEPSTSR